MSVGRLCLEGFPLLEVRCGLLLVLNTLSRGILLFARLRLFLFLRLAGTHFKDRFGSHPNLFGS